jgi:hypothetical protein
MAVVLIAPILWAIKKSVWGLVNDLQLGSGSFPKISERLTDGLKWLHFLRQGDKQ